MILQILQCWGNFSTNVYECKWNRHDIKLRYGFFCASLSAIYFSLLLVFGPLDSTSSAVQLQQVSSNFPVIRFEFVFQITFTCKWLSVSYLRWKESESSITITCCLKKPTLLSSLRILFCMLRHNSIFVMSKTSPFHSPQSSVFYFLCSSLHFLSSSFSSALLMTCPIIISGRCTFILCRHTLLSFLLVFAISGRNIGNLTVVPVDACQKRIVNEGWK